MEKLRDGDQLDRLDLFFITKGICNVGYLFFKAGFFIEQEVVVVDGEDVVFVIAE